MSYDPLIHHRKSIRVKEFDYTQPGAPALAEHVAIGFLMATWAAKRGYFVTIVAHRRLPIFGEFTGGDMHLNTFGEIARAEWMKTGDIRPEIGLDEFVVMPNHFHAIVTIVECDGGSVGARRRRAPTIEQFSKPIAGSIPTIIRAYKSAVTTRINQFRGTPGTPVWQRNYYEHIIRNDMDLARIREYIRNNPAAWKTDDKNSGIFPSKNPGRIQ